MGPILLFPKTYIANVDADVFCSDFIVEDKIDETGEVRLR